MALGLRQKSTNRPDAASGNDNDEESLLYKDKGPSTSTSLPSSPLKSPSQATAPPPSSSPSFHLSVPLLLLRRICQASLAILAADESTIPHNETRNNRGGGKLLIVVIKDLFLGLLFGVLSISLLMILDHRNILHVESARYYRKAALASLNHPDTLTSLEETFGLKFLPTEEYDKMERWLSSARMKMERSQEELALREKDLEEKLKELQPYIDKYEELVKNPVVELDKYCGECRFAGRTTCDTRVAYFMNTYNDSLLKAKTGIMKLEPACKRSD